MTKDPPVGPIAIPGITVPASRKDGQKDPSGQAAVQSSTGTSSRPVQSKSRDRSSQLADQTVRVVSTDTPPDSWATSERCPCRARRPIVRSAIPDGRAILLACGQPLGRGRSDHGQMDCCHQSKVLVVVAGNVARLVPHALKDSGDLLRRKALDLRIRAQDRGGTGRPGKTDLDSGPAGFPIVGGDGERP